ncbi:hypothetical protein Z954_09910 [Clostridium botulinum C/D str. BKT2873]|uniref:DUF7922 domain-containing protein n=1 Tax=Clostridium botulinum TaxID=1491 RepID=UPI0004DA9C7B|nr:hypothetical protein [Clostridium botulinum]KEI06807.1 hypothetical protein Z952_03305 [Clostridium botulinum C/D str. BKT75002]KEI10917.1 hypothetical protein Z954_09910 [Clostridium botulinum C/D str. BKT2873]QPW60779.1 hypothetical protein IG390_00800 [Clostridium botulinum]
MNNLKMVSSISCIGGKPVTSKRNYSRYFIILQEDEKGYAIDQNKFPTGYAKVERKNNKCKVSYYVQNLKKSKDPYYMLLICDRKKDKRLVKVGKINIDDYGRSEISYEYDINNVANCNIPMDNIKGASIVKIKDSNVHGILTGFVSGASLDDWKSYVVIEDEKREETKKKDNEETKEEIRIEERKNKEKEEKSKEENIFDKYEKEVEEHKNTSIKEDARDSKKEIVENEEKLQEDEKVIEENQEIKSEENRLGKVQDESDEFTENEVESDEEEIKDELEEKLKEDMRNYSNEEDSDEDEEHEKVDETQDDEENDRQDNDLDEEDNNRQEDECDEEEDNAEENEIEINDEDTRKCKDSKKSKKSKKEKEKSKSKNKEKDKCKYDNKDKCKDKEKEKSKDNCPYESNCHMNWEKEFYKHIVEGLQEEKGICQEIGKCQWYKIQHTSLMNMRPGTNFSKYSILYYPMMNYYPYIMKKGHYIVGFKYDKNGKMRYLVYGIPGTKSMMDQPFNGATGFVTWVNKDVNNMDPMNMGYWLMFYDFKNSTVVIPVKK